MIVEVFLIRLVYSYMYSCMNQVLNNLNEVYSDYSICFLRRLLIKMINDSNIIYKIIKVKFACYCKVQLVIQVRK